jgi:hypothetical protein
VWQSDILLLFALDSVDHLIVPAKELASDDRVQHRESLLQPARTMVFPTCYTEQF